jgi:hypothetical protein
MTSPELTDSTIIQGRALVQAIEALGAIEPDDPFERVVAELFLAAYRRRLTEIVEAAPAWAAEEILGTSERVGDQRAVLRVNKH